MFTINRNLYIDYIHSSHRGFHRFNTFAAARADAARCTIVRLASDIAARAACATNELRTAFRRVFPLFMSFKIVYCGKSCATKLTLRAHP
jgi:hypothetical protein